MRFTVTVPDGVLAFAQEDDRYLIKDSGVLVVSTTNGLRKVMYSPIGWLSVEEDVDPAVRSAFF